ncbi:MAG: helix-turn-helix domain-containing protein [Planctomycetota bacterium]
MATLSASLDTHKLADLKKLFLERFGLPLQLVDVQGNPIGVTAADRVSRPLCALLSRCAAARACCRLEHRRAIETAFALGESYTFACHAGLLLNCTPLADGAHQLGALLSGQTLPESFNAVLACETCQRLRAFRVGRARVEAAVRDHLYVPGAALQKAGDFVFRMARNVLGLDMRRLGERREQAQQQAQIAETIQAVKQQATEAHVSYPYERERELLQRVQAGDRIGAKAVLNQILGTVMFRDPPGSPLFRIRLIELLAVVSRAAADAGGDVETALARNTENIRRLLESNDHTELCISICRALNEFLDRVCAKREAQVENPLAAVVAYLEAHFDRKLSVVELARQAHLSPSRASHAFREHYGLSMMAMLTRIRLEQAKRLLLETNLSCLEVALRAGYQEQAYFTRMFRRREKVTPRQYRVQNRGGQAHQRAT